MDANKIPLKVRLKYVVDIIDVAINAASKYGKMSGGSVVKGLNVLKESVVEVLQPELMPTENVGIYDVSDMD